MKKFLSNFLLPILLLWNFVLHAQVYQALNIDGFNEDVIANGIGVATGSTTIDMDGVSSSLRSLDWQLTATSTPLASGLPIDGIIPSIEASTPGLFFRLQNYGQNNSIRLPLVNHTISSFVTEQVKAKKVFFLATAASGSARLGYRVIFDDNTIQEHEAIIPDWFNGTDLPIAYKGFGRLYRTNNFVEFSTTNPRLYQVAVNIDPANQTKNIKSVQFSHKGGAGILHVFAVSATLLEACPSPELVTFDLITSQTAKANFIAPISLPANGYKYEVRTSGLPESGTTGLLSTGYIASGSTTQNLVGLPSGTGVQFYIQSNCSAQSQESWKGPFSFTTTCEIQGTFYENFDNQTVGSQTNSSLPQCWGKIATDSGYLYVTNSSYYTGPNSLYVYNNNQVTGNLMLVSPETANLGQGGYQIRFRARAGASLGQTLKVVTLENPNTTVGMNLIEELQLTNSFKEYRINIPHGTHDYFGIAHGLNASYQAVFIDDIRFEPIPTCIVPTELTVSNVGIDRATIAWEASPSLNIEGYSYEIRTSGEAGSGNTGLAFAGTVNATATSVVLADLVTGTEYRVYVKANCGATDTSYWTDGAVFTPDWCKPTYANGSSNHRITTVNIGELGFTDHILSYTNRERMNITIPDFRAGNTYTFNVTTTGYTGMGVAIDFNNDGLFDQVNEVLALPNYISNDTQLYIANVAIPEGVTSGNYRMRIWNREANAGGGYGLDPCGSYNYGTWADYTVHIVGCASLLTLSASEYTICAHTSSPAVRILTGATDFDTLVWQPSIGISGNDLQGWVFNPAVSTVYELTASNSRGGGCTATVPVRITISTPPAPTAVDQTFCKKQNKKVQDLIATGENIKWYADETTTTALLPSTLVNNGTYYATQTVDGCESSVRMAINVVIEDPVLDAMTVATTFRYGTASQTILSLITGALGPYTLSWYEAETGGLSIPMPDFSTLSAGSHSYWVSTFSANGCESTRSRISLSILQMDIWVTANSRIKVYGDDDPEFTYTIFGSVNASVLTGSLSREIGEDRGNYVIQQGSLTASSNYNLNFSGGVLGIISAPVRVTADDQTKMEGTVDPVLTYQVSGLKNNETADDILTGSLTRTAGERAGMYPITQGTLGLSSPNYTLAYTPANLTITSTVLTVKADVQSKGYGDEDPILTYTVSGLDSNVQARDILTGSLSRAMGENTGTYAITQGTLSVSAGYTLQYEGADLTITPAVLTVTADAQTKIYGDTDPSLTYTVSELTFNDQITDVLTGSLARDAGEAIGAYSITQGTLGVSNNYTLRYVEEDLTITPAVLTVTANTQTKGYGDTDPALTYRVSGLKFNEQATAILTGSLVRVPGEAIGAYSITQGTLGVSNNYTLRYVEEDLTITPAVLTVTANTQTKGYGDADPALTYTVSGFKFNEKLEDILTGSLARDAGEARGIYAITQGTIQLAANYMLQYVGADLTITPSVLTVIADAQTKVY
ncbi:MBG domain-containing protein, partial [Myroides odoratus]|uniref:MBG domain-containing protein n=1 Tax=Myroides odoratus TaxID=256 RepID=UPI0039B0EF80